MRSQEAESDYQYWGEEDDFWNLSSAEDPFYPPPRSGENKNHLSLHDEDWTPVTTEATTAVTPVTTIAATTKATTARPKQFKTLQQRRPSSGNGCV